MKKSKEKKRKREEGKETQLDVVQIWWVVFNFGEILELLPLKWIKAPTPMHMTMDF
jgi:hypothetical protein